MPRCHQPGAAKDDRPEWALRLRQAPLELVILFTILHQNNQNPRHCDENFDKNHWRNPLN